MTSSIIRPLRFCVVSAISASTLGRLLGFIPRVAARSVQYSISWCPREKGGVGGWVNAPEPLQVLSRIPGSTPNGAELTMLFVPARIRSRARQKGQEHRDLIVKNAVDEGGVGQRGKG